MNLQIRPEREGDFTAISEVNDRAFGGPAEGRLVERLRGREEFVPELSLVAESDGRIVGHILFFPVTIRAGDSSHPTLALAPMSVLPEYQRQGVGIRLVEGGLRRARELGHSSVVVVGHPDYYPRFGFRPAAEWGLQVPFDAADEAVMALELTGSDPAARTGMVVYPPEFSDA